MHFSGAILVRFLAAVVLFIWGGAFLGINLWGLGGDIRSSEIDTAELRFNNDVLFSFEEAISELERRPKESNEELVARLNRVVSKTLAHIPWYEETDPKRFNQLIPITENFILYFMGTLTDIPEYRKYHFTNYERSLKRGIGICGDASMVLSQLLAIHDIDSKIVSLDGHVVLEVQSIQTKYIADPDFGVILPYTLETIRKSPEIIAELYGKEGYTESDIKALADAFTSKATFWKGANHFMTNKYYFERLSYVLKWLIPLVLLAIGYWLFKRENTGNG